MDNVLLKAYEQLERVTPLKTDCGRLCGACCCKGSDETGMWLLPSERDLFDGEDGFKVVGDEQSLLICGETCDRKKRPYACRIYPLFPFVYERDGEIEIEVKFDPRSSACPLSATETTLNYSFIRAVRRSAKYLCRDSAIREYLISTGEFLSEISDLACALKQK